MFGEQVNRLIQRLGQESRTEADTSLFLAKTRSRYDTDTRFLQKTQRVQVIWCRPEFFCFFKCALGYFNYDGKSKDDTEGNSGRRE